jgi:response regulator RpfG family c-di-GMP phosphodiesterase
MSSEKILFVDDEENVLSGYQRQFRQHFQMDTALNGDAALEVLASNGPYAVLISDLRMPGMDGIQLLGKAREIAPDSVRIMLTGNGEVQTAIDAVNKGHIFRFLTKPCPIETLQQAIEAGIHQHRLITAEHELLEKTLHGSVQMLTEILSILAPQSFGHAEKLCHAVMLVSRQMGIAQSWELEVAAMVCQIGLVTVPPAVIENSRAGREISKMEQEMLSRVPEIGRRLVANIPRLESVAKIVEYQDKHFDGTGLPRLEIAGQEIPLGSRILKVVNDLLQIEDLGIPRARALSLMTKREGWYDPEILKAVGESPLPKTWEHISDPFCTVPVNELSPGMILAKDFKSADGVLLVVAGCRLSETVITKIQNVASYSGLTEKLLIENALSRLGKIQWNS